MLRLLLIGLVACSRDAPREVRIDPELPVRVVLATPSGEVAVTVELAISPEMIERGLMHRTELAAEHGMLFVMRRDKDWSFWMKDTFIPLDIIFITKDLTVAGVVHRTVPQTPTLHRVGALSRYVLEVNGGWAASHGIANGAKVRFENLKL